MFCPNCGKADQIVGKYCKGCGKFISNPSFWAETRYSPQSTVGRLAGVAAIGLMALLTAYFLRSPTNDQYSDFSFGLGVGSSIAVLWGLVRLYIRLKRASNQTKDYVLKVESESASSLLRQIDSSQSANPPEATEATTALLKSVKDTQRTG